MNQTINQSPLQAIDSTALLNTVSQFQNLPAQSIQVLQTLVVADQTLEICRQLAYKLCNTNLVPKQYRNQAEDGAIAIMWGCEIGLQPLQALQNVAVINGNPTLWGDSLVAIVKASGICELLTTHYNEETKTATCITQRKGEPEETRTFSWAEAEIAGLTTKRESVYLKYAKRMIMTRARSYVLRDVYADLLKGFRVREIEQEDQDNKPQEKNITPSSVMQLLAKNKTESKQQATPEPTTQPTPAPKEKQPAKQKASQEPKQEVPSTDNTDQDVIFQNFSEGIQEAHYEKMNDLGLQIGAETRLSEKQKEDLKDLYIAKMAKFREQMQQDKHPNQDNQT